jgi:hypothetical protein
MPCRWNSSTPWSVRLYVVKAFDVQYAMIGTGADQALRFHGLQMGAVT